MGHDMFRQVSGLCGDDTTGPDPGNRLKTQRILNRRLLIGKRGWDMIALDEAQVVRNPTTAMFDAVRTFPARYRVLMTGTPMW
jgi:hypothetical protein